MALPNTNTKNAVVNAVKRVRISFALLVVLFIVFGLRLFYVQVLQYNHYKNAALSDQLKQYQIPANRGIIEVRNNGTTLPIVLNQQLYTLYADPTFIKNADEVAGKLTPIIGGDAATIAKQLRTKDTRYVVLKKKLTADQKTKITALKYPGLGTTAIDYRTYPQGTLAAQLLGFVNDEGQGEYGIEQSLDSQLKGQPGQLKAITDVNGVPLAASKDNTEVAPKDGNNVVLTIDLAMQQQLETILAQGVKNANAPSGSALIMDTRTGAIKAMANLPSYDPAQYYNVSDPKLFSNAAVSNPIEVGSIMKTLTTAAALDQGVVKPDTTYYDPSFWVVDGFKISNVEIDGGPGTRSLNDIINLSLNTGATWLLMQMGGGEVNAKARNAWYDYLTNHFMLGKLTGVEQGGESPGYIPSPAQNGAAIDLTYANTAFGQAMTATPVQMAAALSAAINGGTYYQPHLVDTTISADGKSTPVEPKVVKKGVVSPATSQALISIMQYSIQHHTFTQAFDQNTYMVGGKTGTAQIAKPGGGYYEDQYNGTYVGFVGGDAPQYVIVLFLESPKIGGYAGAAAAQPVFGDLAHMLINNSYVTPKSH